MVISTPAVHYFIVQNESKSLFKHTSVPTVALGIGILSNSKTCLNGDFVSEFYQYDS